MKAASYAFGVCSRWRVALSSDDGRTFSGVPAAVQQIANMLGVEWDDNRNKQGCTPQDGHVMSRNGEPTQYPTFSKCSKESWDDRTLMSLGGSPCYKLNVSTLMSTSERRTPYTFFNCTEPCKNITKGSENNVLNLPSEASQESKTRNICEINCCPDYGKQLNARKGAPDGMPCGPLQVCLQQVCVNVTEQRSEISTVPTDSDK
uniref:Putative metalloprotease n=1 Tax=Ixodes ricinus TaxID=34613 RepID=A0A0K8RGE9_IXORI